MEREDRLNIFKKELSLIKSKDIREFAEFGLSVLPDYFFVIPASSTGKYHPKYALGEGGLVRHTGAAVRIAYTLFNIEMYNQHFDQRAMDMILVALLLHDGTKSGIEKQSYTVVNHPLVVCELIESSACDRLASDFLGVIDREKIYEMIRSHMGQWNTSRDGSVEMPKPKSIYEKFVHMCDYLASRKLIEINFDAVI